MAGYTAGELKRWNFIPESVYGTTPTDALTYGGAILNMTPKVNPNVEQHWLGDTQGYTGVTRGPFKAGFDLEYYAHQDSGAYYWYNFAALYGMGSTSGLADHLASFTAQFKKYKSSTPYYDFYNGCKINSLAMQFNKPGTPIIFKVDVIAQWLTLGDSKTMTGLQNATEVGADASDITTNLLSRTGVSQINLAAGGLNNWYPTKMEFMITREMAPVPGTKIGADSVDYPFESVALDEGPRNISITAELRYGSEAYKAAKLAGTAITALTIPVGNDTITLENGDFVGDDLPAEAQTIRDETIKMNFKTLSIA